MVLLALVKVLALAQVGRVVVLYLAAGLEAYKTHSPDLVIKMALRRVRMVEVEVAQYQLQMLQALFLHQAALVQVV